MTTHDEPRERHNFLWWVTAILAPIGIVGGPIAIADTLSGVITWHGWTGYLVHYWDEYVSGPFGSVLLYLAQAVALPSPPEWLVDYLALGILLMSSALRASSLAQPSNHDPIDGAWKFEPIRIALEWLLSVLVMVLLWPLALFFVPLGAAMSGDRSNANRTLMQTVLMVAPFVLFLLLWGFNALFVAPAP